MFGKLYEDQFYMSDSNFSYGKRFLTIYLPTRTYGVNFGEAITIMFYVDL